MHTSSKLQFQSHLVVTISKPSGYMLNFTASAMVYTIYACCDSANAFAFGMDDVWRLRDSEYGNVS